MQRTFPIQELVDKTGVPRSTIRHYVKLGLLPEPERAATNRFLYDDRHLQRLRLIRVLRERRGLSLEVIGAVLPELMGLKPGQAFRADMWDRMVEAARSHEASPAGRILSSAIALFSRQPYGEVNVDEICSGAGLAKGSFYRYFPSKEELFFAAADKVARDAADDFGKRISDAGPAPDDLVQALARALEGRLALLLQLLTGAVQRSPGYRSAAAGVARILEDEVERQLREHGRATADGPGVLQSAVGGLVAGALREASAGPGDVDAQVK